MVTVNLMNFGPIVTGIGTCVCNALEEAGVPVCTCLLATIGPPAWDNCDCACVSDPAASGQLGVYLSGPIAPSRSFPAPAPPGEFDHACGPGMLVATISIEIARCVPTIDQAGQPPTAAEQMAAALAWHNDATIIRQAVGCCLAAMKTARRITRYNVGATTVLPEQGGCAGSSLAVQVALSHCSCPP